MSEEKMYAVMNDKGELLVPYRILGKGAWAKSNNDDAELNAKMYGGHVVTLSEEPAKVVLTKEQAKIVEDAHGFYLPATLISEKAAGEEEELLMRAYINGYTVASEKKYLVYKRLGGKNTADVQYDQEKRLKCAIDKMFEDEEEK